MQCDGLIALAVECQVYNSLLVYCTLRSAAAKHHVVYSTSPAQYVDLKKFTQRCIYAGSISHEPDVRPSVRPSVSLSVNSVNCDKTKETSDEVLTSKDRKIIQVLRQEKMVGG